MSFFDLVRGLAPEVHSAVLLLPGEADALIDDIASTRLLSKVMPVTCFDRSTSKGALPPSRWRRLRGSFSMK